MQALRILVLIVLYAVVAALASQSLYLLGGGEEACFRALAVNDNPLTCAQGLRLIADGSLGLVGAVLIVPIWLWLRSAGWLPAAAQLSLGLTAIGPLLLGSVVFALRLPHAGAAHAAWEAFEFTTPLLVALAVVALSARSMSLGRASRPRNNAA
jgi:hypothetical protein